MNSALKLVTWCNWSALCDFKVRWHEYSQTQLVLHRHRNPEHAPSAGCDDNMFNSYRRLPPMLRDQVVSEEKRQLLYNVMWYKMHELLKGFGGIRAQWDNFFERGGPQDQRVKACSHVHFLMTSYWLSKVALPTVCPINQKDIQIKTGVAFAGSHNKWFNINKIHLKDNCGNVTSDFSNTPEFTTSSCTTEFLWHWTTYQEAIFSMSCYIPAMACFKQI